MALSTSAAPSTPRSLLSRCKDTVSRCLTLRQCALCVGFASTHRFFPANFRNEICSPVTGLPLVHTLRPALHSYASIESSHAEVVEKCQRRRCWATVMAPAALHAAVLLAFCTALSMSKQPLQQAAAYFSPSDPAWQAPESAGEWQALVGAATVSSGLSDCGQFGGDKRSMRGAVAANAQTPRRCRWYSELAAASGVTTCSCISFDSPDLSVGQEAPCAPM